MGIMKLPDCNLYWAAETRYPKFADVMSDKQLKQHQKNVLVVENTTKDKTRNKKMINF